jgi:hypothetical protein
VQRKWQSSEFLLFLVVDSTNRLSGSRLRDELMAANSEVELGTVDNRIHELGSDVLAMDWASFSCSGFDSIWAKFIASASDAAEAEGTRSSWHHS